MFNLTRQQQLFLEGVMKGSILNVDTGSFHLCATVCGEARTRRKRALQLDPLAGFIRYSITALDAPLQKTESKVSIETPPLLVRAGHGHGQGGETMGEKLGAYDDGRFRQTTDSLC